MTTKKKGNCRVNQDSQRTVWFEKGTWVERNKRKRRERGEKPSRLAPTMWPKQANRPQEKVPSANRQLAGYCRMQMTRANEYQGFMLIAGVLCLYQLVEMWIPTENVRFKLSWWCCYTHLLGGFLRKLRQQEKSSNFALSTFQIKDPNCAAGP